MSRPVILIFAFCVLMSSCRKEEVLLTGAVKGQMSIYDQYHKQLSDRSGIRVTLLNADGTVATDLTDEKGAYQFEGIPYGRYRIFLDKENYIQAWNPPVFYHIGGYSPTYINRSIFEIPSYSVTLDSTGFDDYNNDLLLHLKVDGDTVISPSPLGYPFIAYISDSREVSKDNFIVYGKGSIRDEAGFYPYTKVAAYGRLDFYLYPYDRNIPHGLVYMRIYPLAEGQGYMANEFYREALGKPSNIISFDWYEVTGNK